MDKIVNGMLISVFRTPIEEVRAHAVFVDLAVEKPFYLGGDEEISALVECLQAEGMIPAGETAEVAHGTYGCFHRGVHCQHLSGSWGKEPCLSCRIPSPTNYKPKEG